MFLDGFGNMICVYFTIVYVPSACLIVWHVRDVLHYQSLVVLLAKRQPEIWWHLPLPRSLKVWWVILMAETTFASCFYELCQFHHFGRNILNAPMSPVRTDQGEVLSREVLRTPVSVRKQQWFEWAGPCRREMHTPCIYYHVWCHPCANFLFKIRWPKKLPRKNFIIPARDPQLRVFRIIEGKVERT